MKEITGILKSFRIETEEITVKEINIFNTYNTLKPKTIKFIEKNNYFIEIVNIDNYYVYMFKINKKIFEDLKENLSKLTVDCKNKIELTLLMKINYTEDNNGDLIIKNYNIIGKVETLKYILNNKNIKVIR